MGEEEEENDKKRNNHMKKRMRPRKRKRRRRKIKKKEKLECTGGMKSTNVTCTNVYKRRLFILLQPPRSE